MNRLMQTASVLSFAAALAAAPVVVTAQQQTTGTQTQTETQAEQAVEETAQEAQEATSEATEAAGEAAQEAGQAVEGAAQQAGQAVEGGAEAIEGQADVEEKTLEVEVVETVEGEQPVEEVQGTIIMQDENSMLAGDLIGARLYNAAGETVGEVDDAIISLDGTVEGVVIGVGGFLGIGEKSVAVEMAQISVQMDEQGDPQLVLDTTREALEAAPEFQTVADQQAEARATAVGTTAPVGGTAPAGGGTAGMAPAGGATGTAPADTGAATPPAATPPAGGTATEATTPQQN